MTNDVAKKLADKIKGNGGYYSGRTMWPLSWDVSLWSKKAAADLARLHIKEARDKDRTTIAVALAIGKRDNLSGRYAKLVVEPFNIDQASDWAIGDMRSSLDKDDTYRYVSPEVYEKHGLSGDTTLDVKFELHGRGGKHLCITEFEGRKLANFTHMFDLHDVGQRFVENISDDWCLKLLAYIEEAGKMFSCKAVKKEFEYQLQFQFALAVDAALEAMDAEDKRLADVDLAYAGLFLENL